MVSGDVLTPEEIIERAIELIADLKELSSDAEATGDQWNLEDAVRQSVELLANAIGENADEIGH